MTTSTLYGIFAIISFTLIWVAAFGAFMFTRRVGRRAHVTATLGIGAATAAVRKVGKRAPMTADELSLARQVLHDRGSLLALAVPATLFFLGCFYVFGSLEQLHGRTPSERTFLGIFPMITSTNLSLQILRSVRLKRRAEGLEPLPEPPVDSPPDGVTGAATGVGGRAQPAGHTVSAHHGQPSE
ncbi:hypothetical protein LTT02_18045 [Mycolicibacterium smegmatis]|nr:hypothetical protein [Mycolicibacterium smegmatis]MCP2622712.1 hypothetical protein [Mycolicibacterium smegmatis]MDF1902651.1 hypothetical protein [Mycolicibacterium smegmatis]MDF1908927.1 hypothetical protein [Mycolicibacterium smegmatis]MDF1919998.1 hypothetical protein [Mycolicibacterium smegmatis]MDF1927411.1 hypothetical protein [Mycolicibacterium smegmatis]